MRDNDSFFLGIDTSTPWRTVGLWADSGREFEPIQWRATRNHGRDLLPMIESLFENVEDSVDSLTGIAVAAGPGSFTALRVGVSVAQGLGMGLEVPVVPVGSLQVYPDLLPSESAVATVLLPARDREVFAQTYDRDEENGWSARNVISCIPVEELPHFIPAPGILIGPGLRYYEEEIESAYGGAAQLGSEVYRASDGCSIARMGWLKWKGDPGGFPADSVRIEYHQSHGALTIEERKGVQPSD